MPDCPARVPSDDGTRLPCPCNCSDPKECFGDHACENLGEQALILALREIKEKKK